ncbi:hypothetical protein ARMSODRAFT_1026951 [Armillaria solidipes]|uniref:Uncharacterized protein n=1 Tax=Armillaria solidipes TaxID=1076256 RepID=A0A2H3BAJ5_9AGAR|nr:hypothetical protein ARMSODRAFT_1026951 [Armillaria solidipes]
MTCLLLTLLVMGLDEGSGSYQIEKSVWEAIGKATAATGSTIPSAYGPRVPDIANDHSTMSAEMWSFWTLYIGPCLQFETEIAEVQEIHLGFINWVNVYERLYYQFEPERIATCPVTIHTLLHIADSITEMGPVWCYWAFPMEQYCGKLQPSIRNQRFPFCSMDRFVLKSAQLTQLKVIYRLHDELALRPPRKSAIAGSFQSDWYPTCILLPPRSPVRPDEKLISSSVCPALQTRFKQVALKTICKHIKAALVEEWDYYDPTFVWYEMYVDKFANQQRHAEELELRTFYGQLKHILHIHFPQSTYNDLHLESPADATIILAVIRSVVEDSSIQDLSDLDIHFFLWEGKLDVIDITSVQCLIGRVADRDHCALIDYSGSLAHAIHVDDDDY